MAGANIGDHLGGGDLERDEHVAGAVRRYELVDVSTPMAVRGAGKPARVSISVVELPQYVLHPCTSYLIVPVFARPNGGIKLSFDGFKSGAVVDQHLG
jgi:hypothetical protein